MSSASQYWRLVRIDASGKRHVKEIESARVFFQRQFEVGAVFPNEDSQEQSDCSDSQIQQELFQLVKNGVDSTSNDALMCLRCGISHMIEKVCIQLELKYGSHYGFTRQDLFPLVLDDDGKPKSLMNSESSYQPLSLRLLQTFDPSQAGLSTWVFRQVRRHPELLTLLLEHGLYLMTDWAILNDTNPSQLVRVLSEFHSQSAAAVELSSRLLQSYHTIYRGDRIRARQAGKVTGASVCTIPSVDQLTRMVEFLQTKFGLSFSNQVILEKLQAIASLLRQYRIHVRCRTLPTKSLDNGTIRELAEKVESPEPETEQSEQNEFLKIYHQELMSCLDQTIAQVVSDRFTYLARKNEFNAHNFLTALSLFHGQGKSMSEIAPQVGLTAQYQVSRLMSLKDLRVNIQQRLLQLLRDRIFNIAKTYVAPQRLQNLDQDLDQQIAVALNEQITKLIKQAEDESAVAKNSPLKSLFARRLCRYLETWRSE